MKNFDLENINCHAALAMIEKRWGFPRRTLRALLGMTENAQSVRSLLPICEADATLFLSDVYNKRYTSEKTTSRCPQSGRSMIEMLGVLAIIGVLSVGGIAGYSKAMMKYRINKTIEQITLIAGNIRAFFAPQRSYEGLQCFCDNSGRCGGTSSNNDGCLVIKKAKILPDEMITVNAAGKITAITNPFGGEVKLSSYGSSFMINFYSIPEEACIELITYDWTAAGTSYVTLLSSTNEVAAKIPVDLALGQKMCSLVADDENNEFQMEFDRKDPTGLAIVTDL